MTTPWRIAFLILFISAGSFRVAALPAADWPTFRNTDRSAVSKETSLLQEWPSSGPLVAWKVEGTGRGYGSPVIVDGKLYIREHNAIVCFDIKIQNTAAGPEALKPAK